MNDRFKFRFWNKSKNRYINTEKLVLNDGTYTQVGTKQMNNGTYCSYIVNEYNTSDVIPEQCTGLKDKNGKLIYEGDIVRVIEQCMTNTLDRNYPMLFNEKTAKFGFKHPDGHFFYFTNNDDFSYEVIGNIHENADLIKVGGK